MRKALIDKIVEMVEFERFYVKGKARVAMYKDSHFTGRDFHKYVGAP